MNPFTKERKSLRKYKLNEILMDLTYNGYFNSVVACTTVPFQGCLPERSIGHNSWVRNYDPDREKEATGSTVDINPSSQEE
eukprot:15001893-Ditylum_brightwellii.AAC.1